MNILISTGDPSGDLAGSLLLQALKKRSNKIVCYAVGGEHLRSKGARILIDSSNWSAIGIFDGLRKVPQVLGASLKLKKQLKEIKLDGVIYIDCPSFNLWLAKSLSKERIPSIYFFPPGAWKNDIGKAAAVGKHVSLVIAPFQKTAELYAKAGVPVFFSGHPLLDIIDPVKDKNKIFQELSLDPRNPVIGLFPGSRDQELKYLLRLQLAVAEEIFNKKPHVQFLLAVAREAFLPFIQRQLAKRSLPIKVSSGANYKVMQASDLLILTSGTATLEALLFEKPMLIVYKLSPWTWRLERPFVKGIRFAGLPNLLADKEIVPEFLQEKATVSNLVSKALEILGSEKKQKEISRDLKALREQLGVPGVLDRVAIRVLELFHE